MKIGIIGAGAAGLAAAFDLSSRGHKVVIYESAPFIGGQASTIPVGGGPLERGYHHLFTNDFAIIGLMAELGIGDRLKWYPSRVGTYTSGKVYKTTTPLDLLRLGALPFTDRIKLGLFALRIKRIKDWRSLESQTADSWLQDHLGGFNDILLQQNAVSGMVPRLEATGQTPAVTFVTVGRLLENLARREHRMRRRFAGEFDRFDDEETCGRIARLAPIPSTEVPA